MSSNDGSYYYDLDAVSLGLDSSREISIDMIKKQLFKIVKEKTVLDIGCNVLMVECIEDTINNLQRVNSLPRDFEDISLSRDPEKVLAFLSLNYDKPITHYAGFKRSPVDYGLLNIYCQMLLISGADLSELVLPKQDLTFFSHGKGLGSYLTDYYSDKQLLHRIRKVLELTQYGYEELVSTHFPELSNILCGTKNRFCNYVIVDRSGRDWGLSYMKISTPTRENEIIVTFKNSELENANFLISPLSEDVKKLLLKIGASESDILSRGQRVIHDYFSDDVLHSFIYKRLEVDLKQLFDESY